MITQSRIKSEIRKIDNTLKVVKIQFNNRAKNKNEIFTITVKKERPRTIKFGQILGTYVKEKLKLDDIIWYSTVKKTK